MRCAGPAAAPATTPLAPPPPRSACARLRPRAARRRRAVSHAACASYSDGVDAALSAAVRAASDAVRHGADGDALVLALDVGTTGAKAAAVSRSGRVRASSGAAPYARGTRSDGAAVEQWPADWLTAAAVATSECVAALPPVRALVCACAAASRELTRVVCMRRAPASWRWR
jgi:hypothetical protein